MPKKKKQHFVPKFYLKNFSLYSSERAIGIFNINSSKFIQSGNLKDQAYKNYFYGKDLKIEDALSLLEGAASNVINNIINKNNVCHLTSEEFQTLLIFVIFQNLRTPDIVTQFNELTDKFIKNIISKELTEPTKIDQFRFSMNNPIQKALGNAALALPLVSDLHCKLILNQTGEPFITSDNPVVLYNQFLETRKKYGSNIGFACKGLEIFFPVSSQHLIVFFDPHIYKVGFRSDLLISCIQKNDINVLNLLQCISANKNIYFDEKISESKIRQLMAQAAKFQRKNRVNIDEYSDNHSDKKIRTTLHIYRTDIKCSLSVSFIKILKKAKHDVLSNKAVYVRNEVLCCQHEQFVDLVRKGKYKATEFSRFIQNSFV